ncbi:MAG: MarR family transcriptional regulator [Calditrichia bacterium]
MNDIKLLEEQTQRFHEAMVELIKRYQFRDRNRMTCYGVSVSQCYLLETLHRFGALPMSELADKMHLSISTVTRVAEQLVKKGYIRREENPADQRSRILRLTQSGEQLFQQCWNNVFESEKIIVQNISPDQREILIDLLIKLNQAVSQWQKTCCV